MLPDQTSDRPHFGPGYVPYFYASGQHQLYPPPITDAPGPTGHSPASRYDFTSDLSQKSAWPQSQTVEDIIKRGYFAAPRSEPETALISDKKHTSKLGLGDIIGQVRQRYRIYERNIYQIELGKCYALNSVFYIEAMRGGIPQNSREAYSLTKSLRELYEQQRDERVRLWQDISRLKQTLPEQAQSYLAAYRKVSILEDTTGDVP